MFQVVKQRLQTGQFASAPDAVRLIIAKEGFRGLYAVCIVRPILKFVVSMCFYSIEFDLLYADFMSL